MNKIIELKMKITTRDLWIFSMYHSNRGFQGVFNIIFTLAWFYLLITQELDIPRRIAYLVCAMMFSVIQPLLLYLKSMKQAKTDAIRQEFILSIQEKGLKVTQANSSGEFAWEDIYKTMFYPNLIIIYVDIRRAYLIPKRYWKENQKELIQILKEKTRH